jgi:biopolymer transport protein ExbB
MKRSLTVCLFSLLIGFTSAGVNAQSGADLNGLLKLIREGATRESQENRAREQEFTRNKARREEMLREASREREAEEARSARMESAFDENEIIIADNVALLNERLGSLKELFGVLQQAAGDARGSFESSLTNIQYPERAEFLTALAEKMGSGDQLATIEEMERLWYEIQREMIESGKITKFPSSVVMANGDEVQKEIVRVGVFNIVSDGKYLTYNTDTGKVSELLRQPQPRFLNTAEDISTVASGLVTFGLDPTRGQLLGLLVQEATTGERIEQGGTVGNVIIGLGIFAIILAVARYIWLMIVSVQVTAQKRNHDKPSNNNPLGRVLNVYHQNKNIDLESLELKLGEAVLKETPKLNRFNTLLKVIAVVAPLLGLLGTVTGMIITFQAITLFGAGDPKLMASGISTALVTTVLGLVVAIPTVLLHTFVSGRSRAIIEVLEEQSIGLIADYSEKQHKSSPGQA